MQKVFDKYTELFKMRYGLISSLDMSEDSVRYDFFFALQQAFNLNPWEIQLEHPLHTEAYVSNLHENSKRKEKPQVDLMVDNIELKFCAEFGFFRRNSNPTGGIKVTENTFKMLNDFMRLGLHSHQVKCKSYFVCVADSKMLGCKLGNGSFDAFPAKQYVFNATTLALMMNEYLSAQKEINAKFFNKLVELNLCIVGDLIYQVDVASDKNPLPTQILIWEISAKDIDPILN